MQATMPRPTMTSFGPLFLHYKVPISPAPLIKIFTGGLLTEAQLEEQFSQKLDDVDAGRASAIRSSEKAWRVTLETWANQNNIHFDPEINRYHQVQRP